METGNRTSWGAVTLDTNTGVLSMASTDGVVGIESCPSLEVNGSKLTLASGSCAEGLVDLVPGQETTLSATLAGESVEWAIKLSLSDDGQTVLLSSTITNAGQAPGTLGECCLSDAGPVTLQGDDGEAVFLEVLATTGHTQVKRAADIDGEAMSRTYLQLVSHAAGRALHLGFVTFDSNTTEHRFLYDPDEGIQALRSVCDYEDYELQPGQSVDSELLMVEALEDFHASLHHWTDRAAAHYKPAIWPKIPAGWLGWSWVDAIHVELAEDVVIRNINAIRNRLAGFDIEYVWVSIGNIKDSAPGDWLEWDYGNYPHGSEWLVQHLTDLDFKLGFWCGAFWLCSSLEDKVEEMKDAILKQDGELVISCAEWRHGVAGKLPKADRPWCYSLDPTHPKSQGFLRNVFETYRDWGIRYYMVDFLNAVAGSTSGFPYDGYYDRSVIKGPQLLRKGLEVIREAAGPETYLLSSSGPTLQNVGYMDACRVGNDYGEGRALSPEAFFYPATFVINSADFWTSHRFASDNMAASYYTHRKLYINDAGNVMTVDKPIPVCEAQITATIFGLSGGPVMLGDDIDRMSEDRLALVKKVLPRTPDVATPIDLFDCPAPDYPKLFHQHVVSEWGEWDLVGVLNYGNEPMVMPVDMARLGMDEDKPQRLWEFWNEQYLGDVSGQFQAIVPPRSARLYRLSPVLDHPWVLSTDMHTQQGLVELSDVSWHPDTMTLSGKATRPAGEMGNLFVVAPKGLCVANPEGLWIAKDAATEALIIRAQFTFGDESAAWNISFKSIADVGAASGDIL